MGEESSPARPGLAPACSGAWRWQLSCSRLREARGTDRKSTRTLQRQRPNAQSKQQRKFALVETNSRLCSSKASVYKSKLRLRRVSCNFLTSGEATSGPVSARGWDGPTGAALMENTLDPLRAPHPGCSPQTSQGLI